MHSYDSIIAYDYCSIAVEIITIVRHQPWGRSGPGPAATEGKQEEQKMMFHTSVFLLIAHYYKIFLWCWATTECISDTSDSVYLADKLPLSAHEGDTVLHRQVQSSLYGLLQREVKVKPTERWEKGAQLTSTLLQIITRVSSVRLTSRWTLGWGLFSWWQFSSWL